MFSRVVRRGVKQRLWGILFVFYGPWNLAQNYLLEGTIIGPGAGSSSGGKYSLTGAIHEPDTGLLAGGQFNIAGGALEPLLQIPISGGPTLTLRFSNQKLILSWPVAAQGFVLESTTTLPGSQGGWQQAGGSVVVDGDQDTVTIEPTGQSQFYRLRGP
jgi:hypothetical protein